MPKEVKIIDFKLTCKKCGETKDVNLFYNKRDRLNGKCSWCIVCYREKCRNRNEILPDTHPDIVNGRRTCRVCGEQKSLVEFGRDKEGRFGRAYRCKPCRVRLASMPRKGKYTANIPRTFKRYADRYGLTLEDRKKILECQLGLCANRGCGKVLSLEYKDKQKKKACVDHCHATGKIRGLLCHGCNVALGFLEEGKNRITGLAEYLQKHSKE